MSYAQKNYPQIQGIQGRYSIHDIGCFLTAFCNLEERYGRAVSPLDLNNYFVQHSTYIDVDDGVRDDLGWDKLTAYDGNTSVSRSIDHGTNQTAGWPTSNDAIVRFYYRSVNSGQMIFHFCLVADAAQQTIIDSWDGQVKRSPYGEPTAWAEYVHAAPIQAPLYSIEPITPKQIKVKSGSRKWNLAYADFNSVAANPIITADDNTVFTATAILHHSHIPQYNYYLEDANTPHGWNVIDCIDYSAPIPVPKPPAAPIEVPKVTYYSVMPDIIMYYGTAADAQARRNALGTKNKGQYILLGSDEQARQIVKKNTDRDIIWVNDFDNKLEEVKLDVPNVPTLPVDPPKVVTEVTDVADNTAPVPIPQPIQDIQVSRPKLKPKYFPINPDRSPIRLTTTNTTAIVINSLEGDLPSQKLPAHWSGTFTMYAVVGADIYYLPDETLTKGWYYGIKEQFLPKKTSFFDMNRDGRVTIDDVYEGMRFVMTPARQAYTRLIQPVISDVSKIDKVKAKQFIDGFRKGKS